MPDQLSTAQDGFKPAEELRRLRWSNRELSVDLGLADIISVRGLDGGKVARWTRFWA
jgi:hypothetical protein